MLKIPVKFRTLQTSEKLSFAGKNVVVMEIKKTCVKVQLNSTIITIREHECSKFLSRELDITEILHSAFGQCNHKFVGISKEAELFPSTQQVCQKCGKTMIETKMLETNLNLMSETSFLAVFSWSKKQPWWNDFYKKKLLIPSKTWKGKIFDISCIEHSEFLRRMSIYLSEIQCIRTITEADAHVSVSM